MNDAITDKLKPTKLRSALVAVLILGMVPPVLALALRVTLKDSIVGFAMIYYAFSPKMLALSGLALAGLAWKIKKKKMAIANITYGLIFLGVEAFQPSGMVDGQPLPSTSDVSLTVWNISRGRMGYSKIFEEVSKHSADIIGFVEFGDPEGDDLDSLVEHFPDHRLYRLRGGMAILSKEAPSASSYHNKSSSYRINQLTFDTLELLLVDVMPSTFNDRHIGLKALSDLVGDRDGVIAMGDFNTPYDSPAMARLTSGMTSGVGDSPSGRDSWPFPCPVLAIDQIWATRDWAFTYYSKHGSILSDHYLMKATFERVEVDR